MHDFHNSEYLDLSLFHRIDINLYPLFVAIFEQTSISKAALSLSISQSAASHALQRLRQQLADEVFVRYGNKMQPTPFAEQIYPAIKAALISIQNISQQQQKFDIFSIKTLKIAIHDEIEPLIFPALIRHFQLLNPHMQFLSIKLDRKTAPHDLLTQQIDFIIDLEHDFGEKICFQQLVKDSFLVCSQQPAITRQSYLSAQHIGVSSRRRGILLEDHYLNRREIKRNIFLRCQHYSTALRILEQNNQLVLTIPQSILESLRCSEQICISDFPFELPVLNLGLYWYEGLQDNYRHRFLREEIFKIFA